MNAIAPASPNALAERAARIAGAHEQLQRTLREQCARRDELTAALERAPAVAARLDGLVQHLFGDALTDIEHRLSEAVRHVLGQDRKVVTERSIKRNRLHVDFQIERAGEIEDVMTGQGGSVCNVMSIGLRLIALANLPPESHRRFLVFDEQDCWMHPNLIPRLLDILRGAADELGLQVLVISHHDVELFAEHADRVYRLVEDAGDGARLECVLDRA